MPRMVLLGSRLKIKILLFESNSTYPTGSVESPCTPIEFGIKNNNSHSKKLPSLVLTTGAASQILRCSYIFGLQLIMRCK
ncbi:hypothetical protein KSP40_PGU009314 [Platanthera guangdongensis]|uniref:Uncharacterized protein n=1 Tax=Platanthera guangdongensis TaxID=2320717 RepID=A0ABR2MX11_9ASPA